MTTMDDDSSDARALVHEIEGHLLLASAREEGRTAADRVTARLGWLTAAQRQDLTDQLETEYLALAGTSWRRTAQRGEELRRTYETAYRRLRQRLSAWFVLGCALLAAADLVMLSLCRR
ncbi:hypothetical protein [Streptomyces sp. NPDC001480]|uniref:hypothetical protein n=1 Tax=Streptomyces sp. NPDC001480 TaxID=3364577 RepID=UPI0036A43CEE